MVWVPILGFSGHKQVLERDLSPDSCIIRNQARYECNVEILSPSSLHFFAYEKGDDA